MSGLYAIPVGGLREGQHTFDFKITGEFFEQFEESEVKEGELRATVEADKRSSHLDLNIGIKGFVILSCDRCLGKMSQPVECSARLLVKFGRVHDENDPDIITLPHDEQELDLKQYFYEYILLSLPARHVHPEDKNGKSTCDPEMIGRLKEHIISEESHKDPRWEELRKLMNNN